MATFKHIAIGTRDVVGTADFFKQVFGFKEESMVWRTNGEDTTYPPTPDAKPHAAHLTDGYIGFIIRKANEDTPGRGLGINHFGIVVDDLDQVIEQFADKGIRPYKERETSPGVSCEVKVVGPHGQIDVASVGTGGWEISPADSALKIRHFALGSADLADAAAFYQEMFGFEEVEREPEVAADEQIVLSDGYMNFAIGRTGSARMDHFGLEVDNVDEVVSRLEAAGASPRPPESGELIAAEQGSPGLVSYWTNEGLRLDVSARGWVH